MIRIHLWMLYDEQESNAMERKLIDILDSSQSVVVRIGGDFPRTRQLGEERDKAALIEELIREALEGIEERIKVGGELIRIIRSEDREQGGLTV